MTRRPRQTKELPAPSPSATIKLIVPHPGQLHCIEERQRFNVLMCGRRFGKTMLGKLLLSDVAIDGSPVAWFAPSYKYMLDVWENINEYLEPIISKSNQQDRRVKLRSGGEIDFWSLEDKDAGRGRKYRRVVIDEAGIIRELESIFLHAIRPTLTDLKGDVWMLGTPKGRNFFNACFLRGQNHEPGWASWRFGTIDNPMMDSDEVASAKREMANYPGAYEQEYLGIPADDGANPFGLAAIQKCLKPMSAGKATGFGIDLAKSYDWTWVIGLDAAGNVCLSERWQADWKQTEDRIVRIVGDVPAMVDSTGVGDPIVENLQRRLTNVEGFKFTSQSKQQLMEGLASAIQQQQVGFPEGELSRELETFEFEYTRSGVRYSAPEGLHDDGVCALAMAWRKRSVFGAFNFSIAAPMAPAVTKANHLQEAGWQ